MNTSAGAMMRSLRLDRMPPAVRVSIGLCSLLIACLLMLDLVFGVLPDTEPLHQQVRQRTSENVAMQLVAVLESGNTRTLGAKLNEVLAREPSLRSLGIRGSDERLLMQVGEHTRHWIPPPVGKSTIDHVRMPLHVDGRHWGDLEFAFERIGGWRGFLSQPITMLILVLGLGGFVLFSLYLRRVLQYLDPSAVIPERVRAVFDTFSEGVMVVDAGGRIMLANGPLREWIGGADDSLLGRGAHEVPRLKAALAADPGTYPWMRAMATRAAMKGEYIEIAQPDGAGVKATINCAPIFGSDRRPRGCIVTFGDITELERLNQELMRSVEELGASKTQIERQNEELRRLATRDPLTGCLNRRAFFEKIDGLLAEARETRQPLCCIMTDIDRFKLLNDNYGHSTGDQVLRVVSRSLASGLRDRDLLCRYGGEEFCIILPDVDVAQAGAIAERLRREIEENAGKGARSVADLEVTSSFGVALLMPDESDVAELIDRADQALYASKHAGRNRVTLWQKAFAQHAVLAARKAS